MRLSLAVARQVSQLMEGTKLAASQCNSLPLKKMLEDGVLQKQQVGRSKAFILASSPRAVEIYLLNNFGISDLAAYKIELDSEDSTRGDIIKVSGNSKLKNIRTFKGFLVNSYMPIRTILNNKPFDILPAEGSFTFIYDYERFYPSENVTIVGVENPENFRWIHKQAYLFTGIIPLFVSRYPQNKDLIRWLKQIPNPYVHFGDLDFAGIRIYESEIYNHISDRATFFVPNQLEQHLEKYGNRPLYFKQANLPVIQTKDIHLQYLIEMFHRHQKVLEQEVFIKQQN